MATPPKNRQKIAATNPSLPQELMIEIFSRLPQKSIGRFKCLSRTWLSLFSTPHFLNLCFKANLILITPSHSLYLLMSTPLLNNDAISRKLDFPGSWTQVVGSCKGLVLLMNKECELYLINPVTSEMSKIPHFDLSLKKEESHRTHGFGYDACSNDYKIVTLSYFPDRYGYAIGFTTFVDVYSVKSGVWKRVDNFPFEGLMPAKKPLVSGVFLNGAIHWQTCRTVFGNTPVVARFDLATEVFSAMVDPDKFVFKSFVGRGGRLCAVHSYYNKFSSCVWTMEEYGSVDSWRKFTIHRKVNDGLPKVKPFCFVGEDGVVLRAEDGCLFLYDMKKETTKEFVVDGVPANCMDIGNFVDSLA